MEDSRVINHNGFKVLIADYSKCSNLQEQLQELEYIGSLLSRSKEVALLIDFTNQKMSKELFEKIKLMTLRYDDVILKSAIFGISGIHTIFINAFNRISKKSNLRAFKTNEQALEYL